MVFWKKWKKKRPENWYASAVAIPNGPTKNNHLKKQKIHILPNDISFSVHTFNVHKTNNNNNRWIITLKHVWKGALSKNKNRMGPPYTYVLKANYSRRE